MLSNLFKKKSTSQKERYQAFKVREVKRETNQAITLVFEQRANEFPYKPGQYLTLILNLEGAEHRRSYSLSSSPDCDQHLAVTIKQLEGGIVSNYIFHKIKSGDTIKVMPPMGNFFLDAKAALKRNLIFVGAGSGITPLMSIIKSALKKEPHSKLVLIYGNKSDEDMIFKDELVALQERNPGRFEVIHVYSRVEKPENAYSGRITGDLIYDLIKTKVEKTNIENSEFFLCGPAGMMQEARKAIAAMGVPDTQVHYESFVATTAEEKPKEKVSSDYQVDIILDGEKYTVQVPADKSILKAGLDSGLDMPFSCQSGICTACRGKLLSGKVEMEEDEGLTRDEIKEGYVLCCVGHPLTDDVIIEIG
ncbi:MAG: ferredoxin--NADP reductase [Cyclobacteriaceae bacterium]|nr:ferredoxin--NADP reductase [Cyclobacteriaceae bacterium]